MKRLPNDVKSYKLTPMYTHETIPPGFLKNHRTKENVWGLIQIVEGKLEYNIEEGKTYILKPGKNGVIEPKTAHSIRPLGQVTFFIEFYKKF